MTFSKRMKLKFFDDEIQINEINSSLKIKLWNSFYASFCEGGENVVELVLDNIILDYLSFFQNYVRDEFSKYTHENLNRLRKWFLDESEWFEVYDFVEFVASLREPIYTEENKYIKSKKSLFVSLCNVVLRSEASGYRLLDGKVIPITDENEISEILEATSYSDEWSVCSKHIKQAAKRAFDRKEPDFHNSIKEAISAVESACAIITGDEKATLGQAIKKIPGLHSSLSEGISKLYGYASNEGGIRHGSKSIAQVTFDEAKFMLIICSSIVNFLKAKYAVSETSE